MKDLQDWAAVQKLHKQKKNVTEIANGLSMSRTTVYKLLALEEEPTYHRSDYPCKVKQYADKIMEWRTNPEFDFNGTRIFRELRKLGYQGSISPVYSFLHRLDEDITDISPKATVRIETPIGDQAQFDWSEYEIWVGTRKRKVYCFALILAACRKKAICFSLRVDAMAIYEAIQELFEALGGVTLELLIDNPKSLVIENHAQSEEEIEYNSKALMLAKHLGTELNACNCFWPKTKGKIEKPFQYIEEQFVKGNRFGTMEDLNRKGKEFIYDWCCEVHTTTGRIPNEFYEQEERHALGPLPQGRYGLKTHLEKRIVSNDSYISISTNKYSLPMIYAGKQVQYRLVYGFRIEVYTMDMRHILSFEEEDGKRGTYAQEAHYEEIKVAAKSIPQIRRDFSAAFRNGEKYLDAAGRKFCQPTHHARKLLQLLDLYESEDLDKILAYGLAHDILDIKSLKELIKKQGYEIIHGGKPMETVEAAVVQQPEGLMRSCNYYEHMREAIDL